MFETAEVGHQVSDNEFKANVADLRTRLLVAQRKLNRSDFPVILLVSGVEAAGKSAVLNRFYEWLDARSLQTFTLWRETDEERERPFYWRHWRRLPPKGQIGMFFGSWYTLPIVQNAFEETSHNQFGHELNRIKEFEHMLADDGALIIKLWFHIAHEEQKRRLKEITRLGQRKLTRYERSYARKYEQFARASETALKMTDAPHAPWHIIDASDERYRDIAAGRTLLSALEDRLKRKKKKQSAAPKNTPPLGKKVTILSQPDLSKTIEEESYNKELLVLQSRLNALTWRAHQEKRSTVAVFEGWDAAGKGGAIRRLTAAMDARLFRVIPIGAPTDEEQAHHYLWRFWRHLPMDGAVTLYDRSWYGRVLVERVEGFAQPEEWSRAYTEINDFEQQLTDHGIRLMKFWLHISPEEQLSRFEKRKKIAYKQHKLTEEDWRNRENWEAYEQAVDEMVTRTSTQMAPWTLVSANSKKHARLSILRTFCEQLE